MPQNRGMSDCQDNLTVSDNHKDTDYTVATMGTNAYGVDLKFPVLLLQQRYQCV